MRIRTHYSLPNRCILLYYNFEIYGYDDTIILERRREREGRTINISQLSKGRYPKSTMTQSTSSTSTLYCISATTNSGVSASALFHIKDSNVNEVVTFTQQRSYFSMIFSSNEVKGGSKGINRDGLY